MSANERPDESGQHLSVERILDTALAIVDRDGMTALSMRRLGRELRVDPMAVYHHIPNKQALIRGLVQRVFREMSVSPTTGDWKTDVRNWAHAYRNVARTHSNLIIYIVTNIDAAVEGALATTEALYVALESAGMSPRDTVRAADLIVDYVHGVILPEGSHNEEEMADRVALLERSGSSIQSDCPTMYRVLAAEGHQDMRVDFAFGLETIIAGLDQMVVQTSEHHPDSGT